MDWNRDRLTRFAKTHLQRRKLIVVANRPPYSRCGGGLNWVRPAGGLTAALDPVMQVCGGVWVAQGSAEAGRGVTDGGDRVAVPPDDPTYQLRHVGITRDLEAGYYAGFANSALWPLCHRVYRRPTFDLTHWAAYREVNRRFAAAVLEEARGGPALIFVQDYHFALLPRLLKAARPDLTVVQFWHIPWPHPEAFEICPWGSELLDGLLGNDLLAFHTPQHRDNFLATVERTLDAVIDPDQLTVIRGGRTTAVRSHAVGIDPDLASEYLTDDWEARAERLRTQFGLGDRPLLLGLDRLDYTKGIPERLQAIDRLLTLYPEAAGRFHFLQVGAPSRGTVPEYQELNTEVARLVRRINLTHQVGEWRPVVYLNEQRGPEDVYPLYRAAAGCIVNSLHDGMNLVAKEFVSARTDEQGVLVLSQFTGAAQELTDAVLVNPFDVDAVAHAMRIALTMPEEEQRQRMRRMREQVRRSNVFRWAGELLSEGVQLAREQELGVLGGRRPTLRPYDPDSIIAAGAP